MPRWRKARIGKRAAREAGDAFFYMPDFDMEDVGVAILVVLAAVVVVLVVIPLLLFGIELVLLGMVIAAGIFARTLLGRPWIVQATPIGGDDEAMSWPVVGWRRSARLIAEVADVLSAGIEPSPAEADASMPVH